MRLLVVFMRKNCKRLIKKNLGLKMRLKRKETNYMSNEKDIVLHLIARFIKRIL